MKIKFLFGIAILLLIVSCGCPQPPSEVCGNGTCDANETPTTCPEDCTEYHTECIEDSCTVVEGIGVDECSSDSDCQITSNVQGESFETAIVVDSIDEEYEWLFANGCPEDGGVKERTMQELQEDNGSWFDVLYAECNNGTEKIYYFNIDSFFGQWE
ncbi:MAG: hypothetical protein JW772_03615 [Candidatus Diapherotrites archaeon]|nr:hypothetical protein [Candidatus Diapherotrites archaeon]